MAVTEPKPTSRLIELNGPVTVQVSKYQGIFYAAIRYMFEKDDGTLGFGKNGINIPIGWTLNAVNYLLDVYNTATGSTLQVIGENTLPDPAMDEA